MAPLISVARGIGIAAAVSSTARSFGGALVALREVRARICRTILAHRDAIGTAYAAAEPSAEAEALRADLIRWSEELTEVALRFPKARLSFLTGEPNRDALLAVARDLIAFADRRHPVTPEAAWTELEAILTRAGVRDFVEVLREAREAGRLAAVDHPAAALPTPERP
ncbi:MAG: hypothetical protein ACFBWO_18180 [Paracoccaceae bacterium]